MLTRSEVMFLSVVEWEQPDHQTRLFISNEQREQILLRFKRF